MGGQSINFKLMLLDSFKARDFCAHIEEISQLPPEEKENYKQKFQQLFSLVLQKTSSGAAGHYKIPFLKRISRALNGF